MKVVDFHCDTLSIMRRAAKEGHPIDLGKNELMIDLDKLSRGDYLLQCFAAFVFLGEEGDPFQNALEQIDQFYLAMERHADRVAQVKTWVDLERNRAAGKLSALLTAEDAGCCRGDLTLLRTLYRLGVRIMSLTWNFENEIAFPNDFDMKTGVAAPNNDRGLKDFGREFVAEMERLGVIVDVSHLGDAGFWDVARCATRPFIATHSNARAVCGHVRNLTDDMLRAVADKGGLTGINYCADFLDPSPDPETRFGTAELMARHIAHIRDVGGIDMIALGSDFDGIEPKIELTDCSMLPLLERELHKSAFSDDEIEKIFCGNALRLLREFLPAGDGR